MEEIVIFLTKFSQFLRNEVLDYYGKTHLYLRDLISYKNVDLREDPSKESKENVKNTLLKMSKAIKTGLNTIGVPINKLSKIQNNYLKAERIIKPELHDYYSYFNFYFADYINKLLFEILIEYLLDLDTHKIETLKLFKLITQSFEDKLDEFKKTYLNSKAKSYITFPGIEEHLNFSDLSINIKTYNMNPKKADSPMKKEKGTEKLEQKSSGEPNILEQLQEAKKDFIETLKTPKKELIKPSIDQFENTISEKKPLDSIEGVNQLSSLNSTNLKTIPRELILESQKVNFLDQFGNLPIVHQDILNKFKINIGNFLNSRVVNPDFIDLENLFYYISILKMANIEFPFTAIEILDFLRNHTTEMVFSITKNIMPDPISIFYGLSIVTELNLIHRTNIINLNATEEFLKIELEEFLPEKLKMTYYVLLCFRLLAKSEVISSFKNNILNQVLNLDILNRKNFNPTLDIYSQLSIINCLEKKVDLARFFVPYMNELKKLLTSKGSIDDSITESAKVLLILDILDLKEQESILCSRLLNYIIKSTEFFSLENLDKDFNWRIDKIAYKIELRMLFWALLACSQYSPDNLLNL
ncbi:MAG: hypothetical protein ACFFBC_01445 [Promethearchaeota archaeon]